MTHRMPGPDGGGTSSPTGGPLFLSPPFIRANTSVAGIMRSWVLALIAVLAASVYAFGLDAVRVLALSAGSCMMMEGGARQIFRKPLTLGDGHALLTGVLLFSVLPAGCPWWVPVAASAVAILVGKEIFGGLGQSPFQPVLLARAFLLAGGAIPALSRGPDWTPADFPLFFAGSEAGCLGDASQAAVLAGGILLVSSRAVSWQIPFFHLGTLAASAWLIGRNPASEILSGGALFAAFFFVTDYSSIPVTAKGRLLFAVATAALTIGIRISTGTPEGETHAILLANAATPLIDRFIRPNLPGARPVASRDR